MLYTLSEIATIVICCVIFYALTVRPAIVNEKKRKKAVESLKAGDKVLLTTGIIGVFSHKEDYVFFVKINESLMIEVIDTAIQDIILPKSPVVLPKSPEQEETTIA